MLLALDTATATASLAVYDRTRDRLLGEMTWDGRRRQTQDLLVAARSLLGLLDLTPDQVTALAVTTGPGSFTGVRIAVSTAKGMGLGLPAPPAVIGLPTLCVTAAPWLAVAASVSPPVRLCAVIQAGRGRYNWASFSADNPLYRPVAADNHAGTAQELAGWLGEQGARTTWWLAGEIGDELAAAVAPLAQSTVLDPTFAMRRAGALARLAARHLAAGHADSLEALQPLYLRQP